MTKKKDLSGNNNSSEHIQKSPSSAPSENADPEDPHFPLPSLGPSQHRDFVPSPNSHIPELTCENFDQNDDSFESLTAPKQDSISKDIPSLSLQDQDSISKDIPSLSLQDQDSISKDIPSLSLQDQDSISKDIPSFSFPKEHHFNTSKASAKSQYELERLKKIQENQVFLQKLGIPVIEETPPKKLFKHPLPKRRTRASESDELPKKRHSLRLMNMKKQSGETNFCEDFSLEKEETKTKKGKEEEKLLIEDYDDSSVFKYIVDSSEVGIPVTQPRKSAIYGFFRNEGLFPNELYDPGLTRIYSMDIISPSSFSPSHFMGNEVLVAGGHQGMVSIFGLFHSPENSDSDEDEPLISFRAHKGWVSATQWFRPYAHAHANANACGDAFFFLSAANDKRICLWDVQKSFGQPHPIPRLVTSLDTLHSSGVFSLHQVGEYILSGSKDATVGLSKITSTNITPTMVYQNLHAGVVKAVSLRSDARVFASAGNDAIINIVDFRDSNVDAPSLVLTGMHSLAINSVNWSPQDPNLLVSAGFEKNIFLHDIRNPDVPLFIFIGHDGSGNSRNRSIHHPVFVDTGKAIVCNGDKSHQLSLYSTLDGTTISRGDIGYEATSLCSYGSTTVCLAVAHSKYISIFGPLESCT